MSTPKRVLVGNREAVSMRQRPLAPLLIGITGKRDLAGSEEIVRDSFRRLFDLIERECPHSPKIVISSLAIGADTIAAEEAVRRENWNVYAALPFFTELYELDMDADVGAQSNANQNNCSGLDRYRRLLKNPKVTVRVLEPLKSTVTGAPTAPEELDRNEHGTNPNRSDHYEQAGLFVAENSSLLIAVMLQNEAPDKVGGTARIVQSQLHGAIDAKAIEIIRRSEILHRHSKLDPPNSDPIWLIEPRHEPEVEPETIGTIGDSDIRAYSLSSQCRPLVAHQDLLHFKRIDEFNRRILAVPEAKWRVDIEGRASNRSAKTAEGQLLRLRLALSLLQKQAKQYVSLAIVGLATLFAIALVSFEWFVVFNPNNIRVAFIYFAPAILAIGLFVMARNRRWSNFAEDYRAVSEALRVQLAWWDAGLRGPSERVSDIYMRNAIGSRTLVRAAVSSLIKGALLIGGPPAEVPDTQCAKNSWIDEQITFFRQRAHNRRQYLKFVELSSWSLFFAALGIGTCLVLLSLLHLCCGGDAFAANLHGLEPRISYFLIGITLVLFVAVLVNRIAGRLLGKHWAQTIELAFAAAMGFAGAALYFLWETHGGHAHALVDLHTRHELALTSILFTGVAGSVRFVAEKLSWEAEARLYEEMLKLFEFAGQKFEALDVDGAETNNERLSIIAELGREALAENEAWIRARRERPLEPVLGG
jgi:hypothetical protein